MFDVGLEERKIYVIELEGYQPRTIVDKTQNVETIGHNFLAKHRMELIFVLF